MKVEGSHVEIVQKSLCVQEKRTVINAIALSSWRCLNRNFCYFSLSSKLQMLYLPLDQRARSESLENYISSSEKLENILIALKWYEQSYGYSKLVAK